MRLVRAGLVSGSSQNRKVHKSENGIVLQNLIVFTLYAQSQLQTENLISFWQYILFEQQPRVIFGVYNLLKTITLSRKTGNSDKTAFSPS
jgi:hypothetical protein